MFGAVRFLGQSINNMPAYLLLHAQRTCKRSTLAGGNLKAYRRSLQNIERRQVTDDNSLYALLVTYTFHTT